MLENLSVVLVRPKYPENIGAAARACLNMGAGRLVLVDPLNLDLDKALPLATVHARHLVETARIEPDLAAALAPFHASYGTTARTGGWRKAVLQPRNAAEGIVRELGAGQKVALVFGPEDKGLSNEETTLCGRLLTIPTAREGTSLNLAQAVLVVLYECFAQAREKALQSPETAPERPVTHAEHETLMQAMQGALLEIDFLRADNPDYWMLPMRRFFQRFSLKRHEFNLLMGVCRQVRWVASRTGAPRDGSGRRIENRDGRGNGQEAGQRPEGPSGAKK